MELWSTAILRFIGSSPTKGMFYFRDCSFLTFYFIFPGVLERWQVLQAQALEKDARLLQSSHQWQQFQADIASMMGWLAEAEKTQASHVKVPADIELLEIAIRKHKVNKAHLIIYAFMLCAPVCFFTS